MKKFLLTSIIAVISSASAWGQVFSGSFDLAGGGNHFTSFTYNGSAIDNLTVGALTKVGITSSSSDSNFRGSNWAAGATNESDNFSGNIDLGKYIAFTLTAAEGYLIGISNVTFGIGRSGTGPRQWEWRSSTNNYSSPISLTTVNAGLVNTSGVLTNPDTNGSWTGNVLNATSLPSVAAITLRLYGYNAEASNGTGGLQGNLGFAGSLTAIPEPSTYAAILGGLALAGVVLRRRLGKKTTEAPGA